MSDFDESDKKYKISPLFDSDITNPKYVSIFIDLK